MLSLHDSIICTVPPYCYVALQNNLKCNSSILIVGNFNCVVFSKLF